ncbi:MAG TPA: sulfatase-like hydrolase/transferase [Vicinamibacterales bacterium]|nr:sulfatase-like hydrolase/transferase [Vicinamibacterales bacterium]
MPRKRARLRRSTESAPSAVSRSPFRRRLILTAAVVALVAVGGAAWLVHRRAAAFPAFVKGTNQNVLLITIDTLRADALGCYGGAAATPNIDRVARDGVRFTFAHAHAVVTLVSHTSILTGLYPFQHGVRDNAGFRLPDSAHTLAETMRQAGFPTGAFVGAFPVNRQFGLAQGFDVYDDVSARDSLSADFALPERRAGEVVKVARPWIEAQPKPWFAWVHVFDPHAPYAPPAPFDKEYAGNLYEGEVAYVDSALGPLIEAVRRQPRPTTIIVTGDHGESLGEHGERTHGIFAYEATLHVPLILAQVGPGTTEPARGAVSDVPVRHVDIFPTITDLLGLQAPAGLPGRTLLAAREGERAPRPSYFEAMTAMLKRGWAPLTGIVAGRDKYIDLPLDEMYDLARDPHEQQNLVQRSPERVRSLSAELRDMHPVLPGQERRESSQVREMLESLGYVAGSAPRKARYTEADDPKNLIDVDRLMMDGIALQRDGRTDQAIENYRKVIARRPDMGLAYRRLAYLLWEAGRTQEAIDTLRHALTVIGSDVDIDVRLGTYLAETGNVTDAIPMLESAAKADPDDSDALNGLGIAYARAGRPADALRTFQQLLAQNPHNAYALENIGTVELQQGHAAAAHDAFTKALVNDPKSSRAHAGLGVIALQAGDRDRAFAEWKQAVQTDPHNFDALFDLASELVRAGRIDEARPYVEQFVNTAPRSMYAAEIDRLAKTIR